nr:hypothetical protein L203_00077 [Cryptococcus depauperatus CBS 7841]
MIPIGSLKYKSPHATDLSFAKGDIVRVTGPSPDDEDWLIGETLDESQSGGFPKDFVEPIEGDERTSTERTLESGSTTEEVPPSNEASTFRFVEGTSIAPSDSHSTMESDVSVNPTPPVASVTTNPDSPAQPQSMKDRLAFFQAAQNKTAPPPPIKPKPATGGLTWSQRQKLRQEQEAKEKEQAEAKGEIPLASAAVSSSESTTTNDRKSEPQDSEMSAADALTSITKGGSLKERMAALQGSGAFGGGTTAPSLPASSGKIWKRPSVPDPVPNTEEEAEGLESLVRVRSPETEDKDTLDKEAKEQSTKGEDQTEEDEEKARRAAIAARMARLGARGPMNMMASVPAIRPAKQNSADLTPLSPTEGKIEPAVTTNDGNSKESANTTEPTNADELKDDETITGLTASTGNITEEELATAAPKSVPITAMPRRTAPPRRRNPALFSASTVSPPAAQIGPLHSSDTSSEPSKLSPVTSSADPVNESMGTVEDKKTGQEVVQPQERLETFDIEGHPIPPKQTMVYNEEAPLPKSKVALEKEREDEERGAGIGGLEGAQAAGIPVTPVDATKDERLIEKQGKAEDKQQEITEFSMNDVARADGREPSKDVIVNKSGPEKVQSATLTGENSESAQNGTDEMKTVTTEPDRYCLDPNTPAKTPPVELDDSDETTLLNLKPIGLVPLHPAAEDSLDPEIEEAPAPLPRKRRMTIEDMPLDEIERKHLHDHTHEHLIDASASHADHGIQEREGEAHLTLPSERSIDKPTGFPSPSPVYTAVTMAGKTSESRGSHGRALPASTPALPPQDYEQEGRERGNPNDGDDLYFEQGQVEHEKVNIENHEPFLLSIKPSQPSAATTENDSKLPTMKTTKTPRRTTSLETSAKHTPPPMVSRLSEPAKDAAQLPAIAARMAKLGGIKLGAPPHPIKKQSDDVGVLNSTETKSENKSSIDYGHSTITPDSLKATSSEEQEKNEVEQEETPEQEAARRRATLARLRAGGALGFGMFNQVSTEEQNMEPNINERDVIEDSTQKTTETEDKDNEDQKEVPALLPPRHPPGVPPLPPVEGTDQMREEEKEDSMRQQSSSPSDEDEVPSPPPRASIPATAPMTSVMSNNAMLSRPPVPSTDKRQSLSSAEQQISSDEIPPPPPPHRHQVPKADTEGEGIPLPPPMTIGHAAGVYGKPRTSKIPEPSRTSVDQPQVSPPLSLAQSTANPSQMQEASEFSDPRPSTQYQTRRSTEVLGRPSLNRQGTRPGYDQLRGASANYGAAISRAAQGIFSQGKKGNYGDGSPENFVVTALVNARIDRPSEGWGQVIFEQEAGSIIRKYDEPRPGDIATFYDAKLKGKKGLHTYSQHVGSVEDPLVGVVSDFEERKHKLRVLQVERGIPDEVSYRCEDLKSGKIIVYRLGL